MRLSIRFLAAMLSLAPALSGSCARGEFIPDEPDYGLDSSWYVNQRGGAADLFYICSTETFDYEVDGRTVHFADAASPEACPGIRGEMTGVDRILSGGLNFYSPYYRQVTMETYADTALISKRFPVAMGDVRRAFAHYVKNMNGGRPFVLAGFSQGAEALVELLKELPDSLQERMVAAYVIGWKITEGDLEEAPAIHPAQGPDDTGVTICYNSVRDASAANPLVSEGNLVAINPVNWCTDATPAVLFDSLTVTLDAGTNLLLVDGYEGSGYALEPYFSDGCYHTMEIRWYGGLLKENIARRCQSYLSRKPL